jgi:hypothetical protein
VESTTRELVTGLPAGWTASAGGIARFGLHALDCLAFRENGRVHVVDEYGVSASYLLEYPDHWIGGYSSWVLHLMEENLDSPHVPEAQRDVFADLLSDIYFMDAPTWQDILRGAMEEDDGLTPELQALFAHMRGYLYLTDVDHILAVLASAAARRLPYDPLWLMLVGASSGGKNEALRLLRNTQDRTLKDITLAGLMGRGYKGLLPDLGNSCDALVTIADFSALLGDPTQSVSNRGEIFNALRDIYDGEWSRDINPNPLEWHGRISFVAACTPAIDRYSAHSDALGTRWLYFRMYERDSAERRLAAAKALDRTGIRERRMDATVMASNIIEDALERIGSVSLPKEMESSVLDAANLAAYGRASVPRSWNGEVDDAPFPEEPGRITNQLRSLALGLMALGVSESCVSRVVGRAAASSMPVTRRLVLETLAAEGEPMSARAVERETGLSVRPCKRALEDWAALGFVERVADAVVPDGAWILSAEYADVIAALGATGKEKIT